MIRKFATACTIEIPQSTNNNYEKEDYTVDTGFLIGNEANGLTEDTARLADAYIKIPMMGSVESLNAAVAASVLMFETAIQRRS